MKRKHEADRKARLVGRFVESVDPLRVFERDRGICGVCKQPARADYWELDHIVPLARDGEHSYANVQVAHPRCNRRKWAKVA